MCFRRLLCVRIEIDQLQCVNCWVIIHCLSVSCTKINHSRCALVIWSSLPLTSKQWIITQQITAGADLLLKYIMSFPIILFIYWFLKSLYKLHSNKKSNSSSSFLHVIHFLSSIGILFGLAHLPTSIYLCDEVLNFVIAPLIFLTLTKYK